MFWRSKPNPTRAAQQDSATPWSGPAGGQRGQSMTPCENKPAGLVAGSPVASWTENIHCFSSLLCLWTRALVVLSLSAVYLPGQHRQHLRQEKHPPWMALHLQPHIAACRWYKGSFCTCQMKQKKSPILWGLMQTHLCKIPKPSWKQRKKNTFKREWNGKAPAWKHQPYIAEAKTYSTLQLINKAKFHPDPSPNRWFVCNCCLSSPNRQRQLCFSETRHL